LEGYTNGFNGYIEVINTKVYRRFLDVLISGNYEKNNGNGRYSAVIRDDHLIGKVMIKPNRNNHSGDLQELIDEQVSILSKHGDLATDLLDVITCKWLKDAKFIDDTVKITVDDILELRGINKKLSGTGRRGGYSKHQKLQVDKIVEILSKVWISVEAENVYQNINGKRRKANWKDESFAIHIEERIKEESEDNTYAWLVRPGSVFTKYLYDSGRETALLSKEALKYNCAKYKWEKRLTRYLSWIWRISKARNNKGLLVKTLINSTTLKVNDLRPGRVRSRFEDALNRLKADGVIKDWKYGNGELHTDNKRGWFEDWLEAKVIIVAPDEITQQYKTITAKKVK